MINPNEIQGAKAVVSKVERRPDESLRDIEFTLENGNVVGGALGLTHKTIEVGDQVYIYCNKFQDNKDVLTSNKHLSP